VAQRIPAVKPREVIRALEDAGFLVEHQTGSHVVMRHPESRRKVTVPHHGRDLKRATLFAILKQAAISRQQFLRLLRQ
jgi:predicted RNA binding protein YcfA (HicA-like mRNA interferase family)